MKYKKSKAITKQNNIHMAKQVKTKASLIYVVCITCLVFIFVKLTIFEFKKTNLYYIFEITILT